MDHILIIDDDTNINNLLREALEKGGYTCSQAYSGTEALLRLDMEPFGQGMGAIGLPGDASPASRFVRAAFLRWNSRAPREERANVSQFFHILDSVSMVRGMVLTEEGREDVTTYSCCVNACTGVYYFKTYDNHRIQAVDMRREDLDGSGLISYELPSEEDIRLLNRDFWTDRPICDKIRRQR